jgi:potassium voltage-gated channel Eag-related subfamily H protein 7
MHKFEIYFPRNNYDILIKRYAKIQKFFGKKRIFPDYSVYSFRFFAVRKGAKLRKLAEKAKFDIKILIKGRNKITKNI